MSRWLHSDEDCPRRPIFGRRNGRVYLCKPCGREWRAACRNPCSLGGYWTWKLVRRAYKDGV